MGSWISFVRLEISKRRLGYAERDMRYRAEIYGLGTERQLGCGFIHRWCFDVELVYLCKRLRIPVHEVAVTWAEIPGSKVHFFSFIHMLFELILVRLGYGFHIWKIHTSIQD